MTKLLNLQLYFHVGNAYYSIPQFPRKKKHVCACILSCFSLARLFATLRTVAHQASLSMGFSRQEYWCGLPCPPPGDLPNPGIKPASPALQADSLLLSLWGSPQDFVYLALNIFIFFFFLRAKGCQLITNHIWCQSDVTSLSVRLIFHLVFPGNTKPSIEHSVWFLVLRM